jgi:hypothetical protein
MKKRELHEILSELHVELEQTPTVDPQARSLLQDLRRDIQEVLARSGNPEPPEGRGLQERLAGAITEYEVLHPRLTAILGRVADALSQMGI